MLRLRMGFNVQSITDSHLMLINSSILNENDFVIAISSSGKRLSLSTQPELQRIMGVKSSV